MRRDETEFFVFVGLVARAARQFDMPRGFFRSSPSIALRLYFIP
jgi:hypothetical protein